MKIKFNRKLLSSYIKENNLTQSEFTRKLTKYVPTATGAVVKHWLDGCTMPTEKYLYALSKVLNTEVSNLVIFGK